MATYSRVSLLIVFLLSSSVLFAQEQGSQTPPKFTIGAFITGSPNQAVLDRYDSTGFNMAAWGAYESTNEFLSNYDVLAMNAGQNQDWISYYATSYYSRWEGEQDESYTLPMHIGVKHKYGKDTVWQGTPCWSSLGVTAPACSLMFGPHYRQDQRHKSYYHTGDVKGVDYYTRFNLALNDPYSLSTDKDICVIKVVYRYAEIFDTNPHSWILHDSTFLCDTLRISDFPNDGSFQLFNFNGQTYRYPDTFYSAIVGSKPQQGPYFPENITLVDSNTIGYSHDNDDNGIQFQVDYLGNDSTTLFIDYVEVYDSAGWDAFVIDPTIVVNHIQADIQAYSGSEWDNIKYWYGQDEPYSLDAFTPIRIVDSLVNLYSNGKNRVNQYVQPGMVVNGDTFMVDYFHMAKPDKIIIDPYPFSPSWEEVRWEDLKSMGDEFQVSSSLQPGFWFVGQGFGIKDVDSNWVIWRLPSANELKTSLMQSLAYGVKGLLFWTFNSHPSYDPVNDKNYYLYGLVNEDGSPTGLWNLLHNELIPRLHGKLGDRLLGLDYTGDFIDARYFIPTDDPSNQTYEYLTLPYNQTATTMNWHAGFFNRNGYSDDKYFFLVNLLPNTLKSVQVKVTPPVPGFYNYRFRNYEGQFDTTFYTGSSLTYILSHPAGEGYLYEVAPVVKYGGKLYHDEVISNSLTLNDDMTIENGVILTVNNNYTCKGNIYLKANARIRTTGSGHITLNSGKAIILLQPAVLGGTQSHPLVITSSTDSNSVVVNASGGLTANYCSFVNGRNGIKVYGDSGSINITHCSFDGQSNAGIMFLGSLTASPKVRYSTFSNNDAGIWAMKVNDLVIQHNTFTDNVYDVKLNLATNVQIVSNNMSNSNYEGQGILSTSSTGYIRQNEISGHLNGIYLGNSPMNIGGNTIYHNARHGIYVGTGSVPDLRGYLVQIPCNNPPLYYPLRGYNTIYENGLAGQSGVDNDGSEIYISYASILMNTQCNDISDDREPDPSFSVQNLMGGILMNDGVLNIENQGWGYNPRYPDLSQRFGTLNVDYDPYWPACPLIDQPINCGYVVYATDKTVIDTLYPIAEQQDQKDNLDLMLIAADEYYNNGEYALAEPVYTEIINNYPSEQRAVKAYTQLYALKKVTDSTGSNFSGLKTLLESKLPSIADSVVYKAVSQLSVLCQVGNSEYIPAISSFEVIAEQNTGTEEGLFAEIDALTTAIISYNQGGGLQKGLPGKYQAHSEDELLNELNKIMEENFGSSSRKNDIIPTEYSLYNNYPNPFNPATVIRFDIPERTNVELVVYDILGRRVISLVNNEVRNPGRYEVNFNASELASGVYIYRITTKDYSQARKMLLVK